jgi:hypothetical protein
MPYEALDKDEFMAALKSIQRTKAKTVFIVAGEGCGIPFDAQKQIAEHYSEDGYAAQVCLWPGLDPDCFVICCPDEDWIKIRSRTRN